ncbi:MAG: hypothetical protein JO036_06415 [Candidatus Eremiobacteraeota bacterium]|nr:hypothetical protein [Candidatus Eremiobacteraeota bacterium]
MTSTADRVNYLNIGLMAASCGIAYVVPFELFLFSYAVLGPLHYLTEISWLHDRGYFVRTRRDAGAGRAARVWLGLVTLTIAVMMYGLLAEKLFAAKVSPAWEIGLVYMVFVTAALFVAGKNRVAAAAVVVLTILSLLLFNGTRAYGLIALLLVTIVHVFVFTAAFILFGALKSRSRSGVLSLAVFALCSVSFFVFAPDTFAWAGGDFVRSNYGSFQQLNAELIKIFNFGPGTSLYEIYDSPAGLTVMRLIAFAYTYHYLNWFSKTSIIKWHEVPKSRSIAIVGLWIVSLAIYAWNYQLGFVVLYFLSVLHVMLEFPLNHQSFAGIGRELSAMLRPARRESAAARSG